MLWCAPVIPALWRHSTEEKFGIAKLHFKVALGLGVIRMVLVS